MACKWGRHRNLGRPMAQGTYLGVNLGEAGKVVQDVCTIVPEIQL